MHKKKNPEYCQDIEGSTSRVPDAKGPQATLPVVRNRHVLGFAPPQLERERVHIHFVHGHDILGYMSRPQYTLEPGCRLQKFNEAERGALDCIVYSRGEGEVVST